MPSIANLPVGHGLGRRAALKTLAAASIGAAFPQRTATAAADEEKAQAHKALVEYLESLSRPDGGYGWGGQEQSHLTPTYHVIGCYHALGRQPPNPERLAEYVRTHHPSVLKKLEQEHRNFEFQQVQTLTWLGADASTLDAKVREWTRPLAYLKQYEKHGYPVFQSEAAAICARSLLGLPMGEVSPEFRDYLTSRRRQNGSFNNTPATDGSDGHILSTWWGLQALHALGLRDDPMAATVNWVRECQLPGGGFTWQPHAPFAAVDDAAYTWAAVRALRALGSEPANRDGCIAWLHSLANEDGGFSDRPGWLSNPMATYYAVDALRTLDAAPAAAAPSKRTRKPRPPLPSDLRVWSVQLEAHGKGSPAEAVTLARALRIHLWGAKNAEPGWVARAQSLADAQKVPVHFFASNEEYGTWMDIPGLGTYSHMSDVIAPPGAAIGPAMSEAAAPVSWPDFRDRRFDPLLAAKCRLVWQFGENEELVRLLLDDSVERGGYAAISTFHFGNPDFTNTEPFLHRWRGQIPYVALQDAHGGEPWWFADMTTGFRTLFLATEPTWENWLRALENNWVAAVRHDQWSGFQTWMHSGSPEVSEFIRKHALEWRWWENPEIRRPMASVVAVTSGDAFEAGRPERGVAIRVRCAWENTPQGLAKKPIAELMRLRVDGTEVIPQRVEKKQGAGYADVYHLLHLPTPAPGRHTASTIVRTLATGSESEYTIEFSV